MAHEFLELTKKIREVCDSNALACGVFLVLQKPFDTVNPSILLKKTRTLWVKRKILNNVLNHISKQKKVHSNSREKVYRKSYFM